MAEAAGSPCTQSGRAAPDASVGPDGDGIGLAVEGAVPDGDGVANDELLGAWDGAGGAFDGALLGTFDDEQADSESAMARTAAERGRGQRRITARICASTRVVASPIGAGERRAEPGLSRVLGAMRLHPFGTAYTRRTPT